VEPLVSEAALRRGVKAAASIFLISAGMHATAHYHYFVDRNGEDASRTQLRQALEAHVVMPAWHATEWTVLCMFSLCFAILLVLAGSAWWWMAKELPPARLRALATASALLCLFGTFLVAALHPMPQPIVIFGLAGLSFAAASLLGRPTPGVRSM
jgi:hypothetical protein